MNTYITSFLHMIHANPFFWSCALLGTLFFLFQLLLSCFAGMEEDGGTGLHDENSSFKWVSKQTLTGFLMIFGWTALTCENQFALSLEKTLLIGIVAGLFTLVLIALIFAGAKKLRSSGSLFRLEDTIGKEAIVYQRIPKEGIGTISVSLHHMTHEINAITEEGEELPSFVSVRILKQKNQNTVVVTPVQ